MSEAPRVESLSLSDAIERVLSLASEALSAEIVGLDDALDRTLAEDLISPVDIPAYTNSAMDGYALRGSDLAGTDTVMLPVVGESLAGHPYEGKVPPGTTLHVMTGGVVPPELDTVIPFERLTETAGFVSFKPNVVNAGANVRHQGEELRVGNVALRRGTTLTPAHIGLAASLGFERLLVTRKVRVAVFATGDEVREPGDTLAAGQLYNANGHSMSAQLRAWGAEVTNLGILRDDPMAMGKVLRDVARTHDLLLTSGGVGSGDKDFTTLVLERLGSVAHLHVAMRPGKPLTFGSIPTQERKALFVGLPGNPVAALLSARLFVKPLVERLSGATPPKTPLLLATARTEVRSRPGRTEFVRGTLTREDETLYFTPYATQSSALLTTLTACNACAFIEESAGSIPAGQLVNVFLL